LLLRSVIAPVGLRDLAGKNMSRALAAAAASG
jgi:hypothetical protein